MTEQQWIKPPVEIRYAEELKALKENDTGPRPLNWQLSPKAVRTFILGSSKEIPYSGGACRIRKKYFGNDALVERSIVTLAGNRGLMLVGEPGTANTRDKGVNEMSSALKRRFNFETVQPVREVSMEKQIILNEVESLAKESHMEMELDESAAELLASTYHELREGVSSLGHRIDRPGAVMSTAEAVSVYYQTMISGYYYGNKTMDIDCLVQNLTGAISKENRDDLEKVKAYFGTVIRDKSSREGGIWSRYYDARKWLK